MNVEHLSVPWLEKHWASASRLSEWNTQLEELGDDSGEVLKEAIIVLGVYLDPLLESLVGNESHVSW